MDTTAYLTLGLILVASGLLLLLADLFVPSAGVLTVLSLAALVGGIIFLFAYDAFVGVCSLGGVVVALPVLGGLLIKYWAHTPLGRMAHPALEEDEALPAHKELQLLKGRVGKALTTLKPGGMVDFDGRRVDSLTEGMMVEAGRWVRCVQVRGSTVVVRPVDRPEVSDLETAIFT